MGRRAMGGVVQLLLTASLLRGVCAAVICSASPFEACKEVTCDSVLLYITGASEAGSDAM